MRSGVLTNLAVVALCACTTAVEQPIPPSHGDIIDSYLMKPTGPGEWISEIQPYPFPMNPPPMNPADCCPHY